MNGWLQKKRELSEKVLSDFIKIFFLLLIQKIEIHA
jgi:hypothetical protein